MIVKLIMQTQAHHWRYSSLGKQIMYAYTDMPEDAPSALFGMGKFKGDNLNEYSDYGKYVLKDLLSYEYEEVRSPYTQVYKKWLGVKLDPKDAALLAITFNINNEDIVTGKFSVLKPNML